jgi:hypothetical protein
MASPGALNALLEALKAEQEKRARMRGQAPRMSREEFYRWLDQMHERRTQAPGYIAPSPEKRAAMMRDLDCYFARKTGTLS